MARTKSTPRKIPPITSENTIFGNSLKQKTATAINIKKAVKKTSQVHLQDEGGLNKKDCGNGIKTTSSKKRKKRYLNHRCYFCPKAFPTLSELEAHLRIHTQEKPFPCAICGKDFAQKGNLKVHIRSHLKEKPFKCSHPGCRWSFVTGTGLKQHFRIHSGEKSFVCPSPGCGKAFSRRDNLIRHSKIHSGVEPFACPFPGCGMTFNDMAHVSKHRKIHDGLPSL